MGFRPPLRNVFYSIRRAGRQRDILSGILVLDSSCGRAMPISTRPVAVIGAVIAAGVCLFVALQAVALLLPFVLSGSYRWILVPIAILLIGLVGFLRMRKRKTLWRASHP